MLKASYESQEQVPAELRDHYTEKGGKWVLTLEDGDLVSGAAQQRALEIERRARATAEKTAKDTAAKLSEIEAQLEELKSKPPVDSGKPTEEFQRQLASLKKQYDDRLAALEQSNKLEKEARQASENQLKETRISDVLRTQALEAGVPKEMVEDLISLPRFRGPWKTDERGNPVPYDGDLPMPHPDKPGTTLDAKSYVGKFLTDNKGWLPPSNGAGSPGSSSARPSQFTMTRDQMRDHGAYVRMRETAEKAGQTITILDS